MPESEGSNVRTLLDTLAISKGRAKCRIGKQPVKHLIPAGRAYHKVVEIVDGEFFAATVCPEHDIFAHSIASARFTAALYESNRNPRAGIDSSGLTHSLGRYGVKPVQVVTPDGKTFVVKDVLLSEDGQSVSLVVE